MKETRMPPAWSANLVANSGNTIYRVSVIYWRIYVALGGDELTLENLCFIASLPVGDPTMFSLQGSTLSFLAGCPKSHFLGWYRNFLVYWYLKLDNQVVNSTCPKDKLGWIWRADDP